jgi:hypothetical protein
VLGGRQRQLQRHAEVGAERVRLLGPLGCAEAPTGPVASVGSIRARDGAHSTQPLPRVGALGCALSHVCRFGVGLLVCCQDWVVQRSEWASPDRDVGAFRSQPIESAPICVPTDALAQRVREEGGIAPERWLSQYLEPHGRNRSLQIGAVPRWITTPERLPCD